MLTVNILSIRETIPIRDVSVDADARGRYAKAVIIPYPVNVLAFDRSLLIHRPGIKLELAVV